MRRARCSRILALLLIALLCMPNTVTSGSSSDSNSDDEKSMEEDLEVEKVKETKNTNVVILTTANFGSHVGGGSVWLVEFYAPWCTHCMNFASTYSEVARHFHSDPNSNVRVGKVDTTVEKALGQRFSVHAFPSFFVIRGSSVYEFDGHRSKNNLINFVEKGYKEHPPLPFYSSPMGPLGRLQGFLIWAGMSLMRFFNWLRDVTGLSPILVGCLCAAVAVFGGIFTMIILVVAVTPREKVD